METFLLLAIFFVPLLGIGINLFIYFKLTECIETDLTFIKEKLDEINQVQSEIHRSTLAPRGSLEATKPIKPNNWDSFREAFKGPVRIDLNERN
jgi:hypothetical protein